MFAPARSTWIRLAMAGMIAATGAVSAAADEPAGMAESYAVVALVGDTFTVVTHQAEVGSNLDRNIRQEVPVDNAHFDQMATRVAVDAVRRTVPGARLQTIGIADRKAFGDAEALLASDGTLASLLASVRPQLDRPDTHYLVLISKYRTDAQLRVRSGTIGSGKLAGIGFYIDGTHRMKSTATGEQGRGFLAPYAYVTVSLIDLQTGVVVRSDHAVETTTRANVGPDSTLQPWDALTAAQKAQLLDDMLIRAVSKTVPHVVAPA